MPGLLCLGITFLPRGELYALFLVGRVGIEPKTPGGSSQTSQALSGGKRAVTCSGRKHSMES